MIDKTKWVQYLIETPLLDARIFMKMYWHTINKTTPQLKFLNTLEIEIFFLNKQIISNNKNTKKLFIATFQMNIRKGKKSY